MFISFFSGGYTFQKGLIGWFWPRSFQEVAVKMVAAAPVIWKLEWDWRILFQIGSLSTCYQDVSIFLSHRPVHWASSVFLSHGSWLPQEWVIQKKAREKLQCFLIIQLWKPHAVISSESWWLHRPSVFIVGGEFTKVWLPEG